MNMYKYNDLNEKTVLVTGASGDIGLGICEKY
ncbi:3-oxoacyl-ACP reductase, partial [Escherichia coli]